MLKEMKIFHKVFFIFSFLIVVLFLSGQKQANAYDFCDGTLNGQHATGICFYAKDNDPNPQPNPAQNVGYQTGWALSCGTTCTTMPQCDQITEAGTTYQDISDATGCQPGLGGPVRCCAPKNLSLLMQAAGTCQGYGAGSNLVQQGICYYYTSDFAPNYTILSGHSSFTLSGFNFPNCSDMTLHDFGDPNYHGITDSVRGCQAAYSTPLKCCAPNTQSPVPIAPPPPCNFDKNGNCVSVTTAIGTIGIDIASLVQTIFTLLLSLSGGVALLLIAFNGYVIMTSQGDAEKLKGAREAITAAIIGLVFMIFSIVILKIIGVDILRIPDFLGHR